MIPNEQLKHVSDMNFHFASSKKDTKKLKICRQNANTAAIALAFACTLASSLDMPKT